MKISQSLEGIKHSIKKNVILRVTLTACFFIIAGCNTIQPTLTQFSSSGLAAPGNRYFLNPVYFQSVEKPSLANYLTSMARQMIEQQGGIRVNSPKDADVVFTVYFGRGPLQSYNYTYTAPIYGFDSGRTFTYYGSMANTPYSGSVYGGGQTYNYYGNTGNTSYSGTVYESGGVTTIGYESRQATAYYWPLSLVFRAKTADGRFMYQIGAHITSTSNDFRPAVRAMAMMMYKEWKAMAEKKPRSKH